MPSALSLPTTLSFLGKVILRRLLCGEKTCVDVATSDAFMLVPDGMNWTSDDQRASRHFGTLTSHDSPNTVFGESYTASCLDGNTEISGTTVSTVSTCGSEGALVSDLTFPYPTCRGSSIVDTCMVFGSEEYQAVSNDTSTLTCSHSSSDNPIYWVCEVPLCRVVTGDVIASSRVDFSECFGFTCLETLVVYYSVGNTEAGDKNHTEFMRGSHGHLQGSLECAGELAELFTIRMLVKCVLSWDDHFVQTDVNVSGTHVQKTAARPRWQKGRVEQSSRKWRTRRFGSIKWRVSVVNYEVVHVGDQRAGGWDLPGNTSVWSANEVLRQADGTRGDFPFDRGRRNKLARRFVVRASARAVLERHGALEAIRRIDL